MSLPLNPEDLAVETIEIHPDPHGMHLDSVIWYTNTRPMPVSGTGCTIA